MLRALACGGAGDAGPASGAWSGTITTEGDVTTVVNESGSVWGGDATVVEEASIGVDAGEDVYMLGEVSAVAATDHEIYVLDGQVPALRVYDMDGRHLRDIGTEGGGPAEFRDPDSLAIDPDGRIWVRDYDNDRIMVFTKDGAEAATLPLDGGFMTSTAMTMTADGWLYNYERVRSDDPDERLYGLVPRSLDDDRAGDPIVQPELDFEPWRLTVSTSNMRMTTNVPFAPSISWTVAPSGALVVGVSDEYSFDIRHLDGSVTRVVKPGAMIAVGPAEADWYRKRSTAQMRQALPDWSWNGPEIPALKPAYQQLLPDHSGRVWVVRPGPGYHVEGPCQEDPASKEGPSDPCWRAGWSWEVFGEDGRFLGGVEVPEGVGTYPAPFIRDDMILAPFTDDAGITMVKRYRLVIPTSGG